MSLNKKIKNSQGTKTNIRGFFIVLFVLLFSLFAAFFYGGLHKNPQILSIYEKYFGDLEELEKTASSVQEAAEQKTAALEKKAKEAAQSLKAEVKETADKTKEAVKSLKEKATKALESTKTAISEKVDPKLAKTEKKIEAKKPVFEGADIKAGGGNKIMGFAPPGWSVMLKSGKDTVGKTVANSKDGRWVIFPDSKKMASGEKVLELVTTSPNKETTLKSDQQLAVIIPKTRNAKAKVMRQESGKPVKVLQEGELHLDKPKVVKTKDKPKPVLGADLTAQNLLSFGNFDYKIGGTKLNQGNSDPGSFSLDGKGSPNGNVNIFLNGEKVGSAKADSKGEWNFQQKFALKGKKQTIKIEQIDTKGKVTGTREKMFRTEIPVATRTFNKEAFKVSPAKKVAEKPKEKVVVNIPDKKQKPVKLLTTSSVADRPKSIIVVLGDTLWGLAITYYGDGQQYKKIYAANQNQIKDPDLIYPGQNLKLP